MEYKDTLNLPKTKFKMKANLAQEEPKLLNFWREEKIYEKVCEEKSDWRDWRVVLTHRWVS